MIIELQLSKIQEVVYVSQPSDATKNVVQSINYEIKLKQSEFKWYAKKILSFEHFLSKIRDRKKLPLNYFPYFLFSIVSILNTAPEFSGIDTTLSVVSGNLSSSLKSSTSSGSLGLSFQSPAKTS